MRLNIQADLDYYLPDAADVLLAIEVAQLPDQRLIDDRLVVDGVGPMRPIAGEDGIGRRTWMRAEGRFHARYSATIDVDRSTPSLEGLAMADLHDLPSDVVPYLWPSRYCESDRFVGFVEKRFDPIAGGARVHAMAEWIGSEMDYVRGTSDGTTTAADAFVARRGVCRDYAHLLAAFARASGIPARLVSAYAEKLDPPDFHAVVEVWLEGGWHLTDATGLAPLEGLARICVGRDATDIAFMTIFGMAELNAQSVSVTRVANDD